MSASASVKHWTIREEEDYIHEEILGKGGFGEVHKLYDSASESRFARKIIRPWGPITEEDVNNEVRALNKLCKTGHPNIVQVLAYGQLKNDGAFYFIDMELCGATLENYLKGRDIPELMAWTEIREKQELVTKNAYNILQHIINGLVYIHSQGEVHRDLSPQNVLYSDKCWKIADFGLACEATSNRLVTTSAARGKPCYRAPELLHDAPVYNNKSDMWSLGCIVFELFTGRKAFLSDYQVFNYANMVKNQKEFLKQLNSDARFYIHGLLEKIPKERPSSKFLMRRKFKTQWSNISNAPHKRKTLSDTERGTKQLPPSIFLSNTLRWAINRSDLPTIESLLYGLESVIATDPMTDTELMRSIFAGDVAAVQCRLPIRDANEALVALLAALTASNDAIVRLLLNRVPNEDETENRVAIYKTVWKDHVRMLQRMAQLGERLIGEHDTLHKKVFYSLIMQYNFYKVSEIAMLLPNIMSFGRDWVAVMKSPLRINLRELHCPDTVAVTDDIQEVRFSVDGRYLAYSTSSTMISWRIHIHEVATGVALGDHQLPDDGYALHTSLAHNGHHFYWAYGSRYGSIRVLRFTVGGDPEENLFMGSHNGPVLAISSSSNGLRVISGSGQGPAISVWDCQKWTRLRQWEIGGRPSDMAVALSPDGELAGLALYDHIQIWCLDSSATAVYRFNTPSSALIISFNDNPAKRLVTRAASGTRTFDVLRITESQESSGLKSISLKHVPDPVGTMDSGDYKYQVEWSPGNEWFAVVRRGLIRLARRAASGLADILLFQDHYNKLQNPAFAFGPQGSGLLATGEATRLRIWRIDSTPYPNNSENVLAETESISQEKEEVVV